MSSSTSNAAPPHETAAGAEVERQSGQDRAVEDRECDSERRDATGQAHGVWPTRANALVHTCMIVLVAVVIGAATFILRDMSRLDTDFEEETVTTYSDADVLTGDEKSLNVEAEQDIAQQEDASQQNASQQDGAGRNRSDDETSMEPGRADDSGVDSDPVDGDRDDPNELDAGDSDVAK